jgi:hypothetical protein
MHMRHACPQLRWLLDETWLVQLMLYLRVLRLVLNRRPLVAGIVVPPLPKDELTICVHQVRLRRHVLLLGKMVPVLLPPP